DSCRLYIHPGNCAGDRGGGVLGLGWHAALALRGFGRRRKALRREFAIFDVEQRSDYDDLVPERSAEEFLVSFGGARSEISEGKRWDVPGSAGEIKRHRVGHDSGDRPAREHHLPVRRKLWRRPHSSSCELHGHRRRCYSVDEKRERNAPHDVVAIIVNIESANVALIADGCPLAGGWQDRLLAVLNFAQYHLAVA